MAFQLLKGIVFSFSFSPWYLTSTHWVSRGKKCNQLLHEVRTLGEGVTGTKVALNNSTSPFGNALPLGLTLLTDGLVGSLPRQCTHATPLHSRMTLLIHPSNSMLPWMDHACNSKVQKHSHFKLGIHWTVPTFYVPPNLLIQWTPHISWCKFVRLHYKLKPRGIRNLQNKGKTRKQWGKKDTQSRVQTKFLIATISAKSQ
jgi:hypothetical protein